MPSWEADEGDGGAKLTIKEAGCFHSNRFIRPFKGSPLELSDFKVRLGPYLHIMINGPRSLVSVFSVRSGVGVPFEGGGWIASLLRSIQ